MEQLNWFIHEVVGAIIALTVTYLLHLNWGYFWLFVMSQTAYRKKRIRLSISYLYRIKIDGNYLLVKGMRIKHQFQPVGGVYKRLPESVEFFNKIGVRDDKNIPIDETSRDDLRINMEGKHLYSFLSWYKKGEGRENSVFREFYEELIAPNYVPTALFPYINYRYIKQVRTKISFSTHFQMDEIMIAEIYEFIPNQSQLDELKELMNRTNDNYIWVDEETILKRGANKEIIIAPTAEWIL